MIPTLEQEGRCQPTSFLEAITFWRASQNSEETRTARGGDDHSRPLLTPPSIPMPHSRRPTSAPMLLPAFACTQAAHSTTSHQVGLFTIHRCLIHLSTWQTTPAIELHLHIRNAAVIRNSTSAKDEFHASSPVHVATCGARARTMERAPRPYAHASTSFATKTGAGGFAAHRVTISWKSSSVTPLPKRSASLMAVSTSSRDSLGFT